MAMKRQVKLLVSDSAGQWFESYQEGESGLDLMTDAEVWGRKLVLAYNTTLRPGELTRTFIKVESDTLVEVEEEEDVDEIEDEDDWEDDDEREEDGDDRSDDE